jgi:8-oxo-dGTP pyrophosphatase MutT (NUDIX family)
MEDTFRVAVTAIVRRPDGKMLITRRSPEKKRWPGKWTVPGGGLEKADYLGTPTEINEQWYGVLENAVRREVKEETNLNITDIDYLCCIGIPDCVIVSYVAETDQYGAENEVRLQEGECDQYAWVTAKEAREYDLIDGLQDELVEAELKGQY